MLAPLGARGDMSYFNEENYMAKSTCYYDISAYKTKELLLGWRAVVDKVCVWSYCNDFSDLFTPFNCWDAFEENYRWYKKIKAEFVFEEGSYCKYTPNFSHLRSYLVSKLMWDTDMTKDEYYAHMDEFLENVYGPGWESIKNFLLLTVAGIINAFGVTFFLAPVKLYDSGISGTSMLSISAIFTKLDVVFITTITILINKAEFMLTAIKATHSTCHLIPNADV